MTLYELLLWLTCEINKVKDIIGQYFKKLEGKRVKDIEKKLRHEVGFTVVFYDQHGKNTYTCDKDYLKVIENGKLTGYAYLVEPHHELNYTSRFGYYYINVEVMID